MTHPDGTERAPRRRRRRHPKPAPPPPTPAAVLANAKAPVLDASLEAPMTAAEVARMKATLRFLREHRETLKLKVNAAEDLLLNGKREPTHRGLLQHLLSKLDRSRVLQASERMPPQQATEFLAGIVRFAPEIPYVLRFLECVKASAHPKQAAAALTQALEQIDLNETSMAQMRDLLQLVVDVFPASELPVFALSLLGRAAFRSAFDRSSEGLPPSLAELLLPLRAFERWTARRDRRARRPRADEPRLALERVREGAARMLGASPESLLELSEPLRRQIFELAAEGLGRGEALAPPEASAAALLALLGSVHFQGAAVRSAAVLDLAAALLRIGLDRRARDLLRAEQEQLTDPRTARHWLGALDGERVGDIALEPRGRRGRDEPRRDESRHDGPRRAEQRPGGQHRGAGAAAVEPSAPAPRDSVAAGEAPSADRWQRGWHIPSQREVLVRVVEGTAAAALSEHAELRARALLPGIAPVVSAALGGSATLAGSPSAGKPLVASRRGPRAYLALAWLGPALPRSLQAPGLAREQMLGWCQEGCRLLAGLAAFGLELPDAAPARFSVDANGRLWLVDLWQLRAAPPADAARAHTALARQLCTELLGALELDVLPIAASAAFDGAASIAELSSALSLAD